MPPGEAPLDPAGPESLFAADLAGTAPDPPETPRRGRPIAALAIALVVSVVANAILAVRLRDAEDDVGRLRARVAFLEREAERTPAPTSSPDPTPQPGALDAALAVIASAVEEIRGVDFPGPVDAEVVGGADLASRVGALFEESNPRPEVDANAKVLVALGLIPPGTDLYQLILELHQEQVAGFYDTQRRRLVVGTRTTGSLSPLDRVLLAHEYTHALADQRYDLSVIDRLADRREDERATALVSLAEGDATLTMLSFRERFLTPAEQTRFADEVSRLPRDRLNAAPQAIQRVLAFPYEAGLAFVQALVERGGRSAVDAAYRDPPVSTEQIIHPERYYGARDIPRRVAMPDLAAAMPGWRRIDRGDVGELDVQLIVSRYLSDAEAARAADGWDGGLYAGLESASGTLVALLTVWDSEAEAREATEILGRWLPLRFSNRGEPLSLAGAVGRGWTSQEGAGAVLRSGSRVLVLVAPDRAAVTKARAAFSGF